MTRTVGFGKDDVLSELWNKVRSAHADKKRLLELMQGSSNHANTFAEDWELFASLLANFSRNPDTAILQMGQHFQDANAKAHRSRTRNERLLAREWVRFWDGGWDSIGSPPVKVTWTEDLSEEDLSLFLGELQGLEETLEVALLPPRHTTRGVMERLNHIQFATTVLALQAVQIGSTLAELHRVVGGTSWVAATPPVPPLPIRFAVKPNASVTGLELQPRFQLVSEEKPRVEAAPSTEPVPPPDPIPVGIAASDAKELCAALLRELVVKRDGSVVIRQQELAALMNKKGGPADARMAAVIAEWSQATRVASDLLREDWSATHALVRPPRIELSPEARGQAWQALLEAGLRGVGLPTGGSVTQTPLRAEGMQNLLLANIALRSSSPAPIAKRPELPTRHPALRFLDRIHSLVEANRVFAAHAEKVHGYKGWTQLDPHTQAVINRLTTVYRYAPAPHSVEDDVPPMDMRLDTPFDYIRRVTGYLNTFH